ncbi:MAG TPA: hypothetical protein VN844_08610 [Pyrinomonadaceae bacterium]|nr:hypothetical protein [Pyrinomonadaceae bacterium]
MDAAPAACPDTPLRFLPGNFRGFRADERDARDPFMREFRVGFLSARFSKGRWQPPLGAPRLIH